MEFAHNLRLTGVIQSDGQVVEVPDMSKIRILNSRMIVSRKRTKNLFDLTSLWKKIVLLKMEERVLQENHDIEVPANKGPAQGESVSSDSDMSDTDVNHLALLNTIGWLS